MTDERDLLRASAHDFLDRWSPISEARRLTASADGFDRSVWMRIVEMGWPALLVPESAGGLGASFSDAAVIAVEMGRHVVPSPFLASSVLATSALALGDTGRHAQTLLALAEGAKTGTVALTGPSGAADTAHLEVVATPRNGGWQLDGSCGYVPDLSSADLVVVAARTPEGTLLVALVPTADPGVLRSPLELFDETRRVGTLTLVGVDVDAQDVLASGPIAAELIERLVLRGKVILAADAVGAAGHALRMATDYAKTRVQFDRPVGSFQAVKHKLADMFALVETATAAVEQAAELMDSDPDSRLIVSATSYALDAAVRVAGDAIQVHGGIGFTWEYDSHLLLKRTLLDEALICTSSALRERVAQSLFADVG